MIPETRRPPELPGFDASLRLLVQRERYSQSDIAMMFGVSAQRVSQWLAVRGINYASDTPRGMYATRVWNDTLNRFEPEYRSVAARRARRNRRETARLAREQVRASWTQRAKAEIARLTESLQRTPSWDELAVAMGLRCKRNVSCMYVIQRCVGASGGMTTADMVAVFCATTGFVPRARGGAGHLSLRSDRTQCRMGHAYTEENTYRYTIGGREKRYCKTCHAARSKRYYERLKDGEA